MTSIATMSGSFTTDATGSIESNDRDMSSGVQGISTEGVGFQISEDAMRVLESLSTTGVLDTSKLINKDFHTQRELLMSVGFEQDKNIVIRNHSFSIFKKKNFKIMLHNGAGVINFSGDCNFEDAFSLDYNLVSVGFIIKRDDEYHVYNFVSYPSITVLEPFKNPKNPNSGAFVSVDDANSAYKELVEG